MGTLVDYAPDGAQVVDIANPEHALPIRSTDETCAFSFAGAAAKAKTEFSIKVQDAGAEAAPGNILGLGPPSDQCKRKRSDGRKRSHWPILPSIIGGP
jgi:hypothetical protein